MSNDMRKCSRSCLLRCRYFGSLAFLNECAWKYSTPYWFNIAFHWTDNSAQRSTSLIQPPIKTSAGLVLSLSSEYISNALTASPTAGEKPHAEYSNLGEVNSAPPAYHLAVD